MAMSGQVHAQDADTVEAEAEVDAIVVTGSRLRTDGMQAPVPVTVVQAETLQAAAPDTLITAVSQLPQFYGNQTPNSGNFFTRSGYGALNLRGLGVNRTLTLLNGRRMPASSAFGGVDINLFPEAMIQSVETVTGGASAAYGSDAVAGVVNFILDDNYTGLDLKLQGGITDRNDGENWKASASYGTNLGDRAHLMVSGEYFDQAGVFGYAKRDWYQAWGPLGSGTAADPYTFSPNVISRNASFDGVIFAPGTAINGLAFDRNGNTSPFVSCAPSQGTLGTPPARHVAPPGSNCSGDDLGANNALYPDLKRYSAFGHLDYDLTDNLTAYVQYMRGWTKTKSYNTPRGSFGGTPTALTIFRDNAFLPASLRATMAANNINSFTLRRMGSIEDIGRDYYLDDRTTQDIGTAGLTYDFGGGALEGWRADAFVQYGKSLRDWRQNALRVDRIFAAADAVVDPATGNIVCRVSLFGNAFPGCQPINLFGRGNASPQSVDYVVGFEPGQQISTPLYFADTGFSRGETYDYTSGEAKRNLTTFKQRQAEFSLSGDLFEGWAGPIAAAFGAAYRKETVRQIVQDVTNPSSNHDAGHPVLCNGQAPGLRGVSAADCANTVGVQYSKVSNIRGSSTVKEGFAELLVPLIAGGSLLTEAAANAAVRYADYSGSGGVWAYKGGLEVEFADSFRLRGTYSRDVRAGNLSERFDKTGGTATVTDPAFGGATVTVTRFSGGNPAVRPEKADTYTLGAVFQPAFAPGLSLSVDWYDIKLKDAISQVGNQEVINRCQAGDPSFCALVTRDPATNALVLVGDVFVNVAQSRVSGIDAEAAYRSDANLFSTGDEDFGIRLFASWLNERSETDFRGNKIDYAGQTGARQSDGVYFAYPDFKATGNLTYRIGNLSTFLQGRYIGKGKHDLTPTNILADNTVDAVFYTDLNLAYDFAVGGADAEMFLNINNLFDSDPPVTPSYTAFLGYSTQVNTALYDVLGRRYTVGVKIKM